MVNTTKLITIIAVAFIIAACGNASKTASTTVATDEVSTNIQSETKATALSTGNFVGKSDHITTGQVTLEKTTGGYQLNFASDFSLDGAPDPIVAIGNSDVYQAENKIGALKNITGSQVYQLPADFTPGQFSQVYIWCEKFSVPLGIADLE